MTRNKSLQLIKVDGKPGEVYYPLLLVDVPVPEPQNNQVLLRIHAVSINHRPTLRCSTTTPPSPPTSASRSIRRALGVKSGGRLAAEGCNVLITGIGGGVALAALQFAVAKGHRVFVTSSDPAKLDKARRLGATAGVSYRDPDWDRQLGALLPKHRPSLDLVVDGAGGDVVGKAVRLLRTGGVIVQYGMTAGPRMDWLMAAVLKNIELRGTTMGSRDEFREMMEAVERHEIRPVVSRMVVGLDNLEAIDGLFDEMKHGRQFGKLVVELEHGDKDEPRL